MINNKNCTTVTAAVMRVVSGVVCLGCVGAFFGLMCAAAFGM